MKDELFEDMAGPSARVGTHRWYTVPLSIVSHVILVAVFVIVPLTAIDVIPTAQSVLVFAAPPPPPPVELPPPPVIRATPSAPVEETRVSAEAAPLNAPSGITEPVAVRAGARPAARLTVSGSADVILMRSAPAARLAAPPATRPLPVGGAVGEPRKVHHVAPAYPPIARAARAEGLVILEATIARDGRVRDAKVLRSDELFDQAAIAAVRQWRYTPPTLNGEPVDVTMTVTVRFLLN